MRVLLFSDLHAHAWQEFSDPVPYGRRVINSRLRDAVRVIEAVGQHCVASDIGTVVFAGDLFHRRHLIDVTVFNVVAQAIWALAKKVERVVIIMGNHDAVRKADLGGYSSEHALYALRRTNVKVVDEPFLFDGLGALPYATDAETLRRSAQDLANRGACALIMHAGIAGAKTGTIEFRPLEDLELAQLPHVPVYSGHYHAPQVLHRNGAPDAVYVGAPLELVRGDHGSKMRGWLIFDTNNPQKYVRVKHGGPAFVTVDVASAPFSLEGIPGNFIDLRASPDESKIDDCREQLLALGARAVNVVWVAQKADAELRMPVQVAPGKLPSVRALVDAYIETANQPDLDRRVLKSLASEALGSAG